MRCGSEMDDFRSIPSNLFASREDSQSLSQLVQTKRKTLTKVASKLSARWIQYNINNVVVVVVARVLFARQVRFEE
uniref:Uncharacterized protein n=1 Tax=Rhizophora mucronata TaxID=61149 RepID=A0A2P2M9L3_RHIMU